MGLGDIIDLKHLATFAFFFDTQQSLTLSIGDLPTGCFQVKVSWTFALNVLRAVQDHPTGFFAVPEI